MNFNPRSREGSDYAWGVYCTAWANFNPRSREGSDSFRRIKKARCKNFNPRSREGSDNSGWSSFPFRYISIRAPARGATSSVSGNSSLMKHFNPRSREGSDCGNIGVHFHNCDFNPRSREGSDDHPVDT